MSPPSPTSELRQQVRLAVPLAAGHLGHHAMSMVDTAMLGRYSDSALAGTGIASSLLFCVLVLGTGTIMGLDTLVPQALGANQPGRARHLLRQGLRLSLYISIPLTLVVGLIPLLLPLAGVPADVAAEARSYAFGRMPSIMPALLFATLRSYLQASSVTWPIVITTVVGNLLNLVLDYVFIFGDAGLIALGLPAVGLPAFGVLGAALTTTVVSIVSVLVCAAAVLRMHAAAPIPAPQDDGSASQRQILRLGLPVGMQLSAEVGIFALVTTLAGRLGTTAAAGHHLAVILASFSFNAAIGVGAATSVRVGLAVGARDRAGARRAGFTGIALGMTAMSCAALVFLLLPEQLARLFTDAPAVIHATAPLLRIAALFQLCDGAQAVAAGALRGAGDTRSILWANLFGHYVVALGVAIGLAFGLEMGAPGLWWGLSAGLTVVAILLIGRFYQLIRGALTPIGD